MPRAIKLVNGDHRSIFESRRPLTYTPGTTVDLGDEINGYGGIWACSNWSALHSCGGVALRTRPRDELAVVELEYDDPADVLIKRERGTGFVLKLRRARVVADVTVEHLDGPESPLDHPFVAAARARHEARSRAKA